MADSLRSNEPHACLTRYGTSQTAERYLTLASPYMAALIDKSFPRGLIAFDLDGTLLRDHTVCELLAIPLGRVAEMARIEALSTEEEIAEGRVEMAGWYKGQSFEVLYDSLSHAVWAPGAQEAVQRLRRANVVVAIASYTWSFAVEWFAERLNVSHHLGTSLSPQGEIRHVWARDKASWLLALAASYGIPRNRTAAVGDTRGDFDMLRAAGVGFFVGLASPPHSDVIFHKPGADLRVVADEVLERWT